MLPSAEYLRDWFIESGLLTGATVSLQPSHVVGKQSGQQAAKTPQINVTEQDLSLAIELREAIYALVWARLHQAPLPADAMRAVNGFAAHAPLTSVLSQDGWFREGSARQALSTLAREAIELVGGEQADLLRECGRPVCTQVYLDHSRGQRREWCSMATCGSRMKAKAYRDRKKAEAAK